MAYIGKKPSDITRAIATNDTFTGDGSTTTFTLSQGAASANDLTVVVNNVRQEPGSGSKSYTLTAPTSLVFNTAPVASDEIYVINPTQVEAIVRAGDISSGVVTGQTAETTPADGDHLLMFDASAGALRKITKANLVTSAAITANTAKVTNATHTGEVTGATALTIADNAVTLAKMASGTDGNLITYDANGDPAAVATGTAGQVLTSAGAGAPPTFSAGGSMILLKTVTASNVANVVFDHGSNGVVFDTTYKSYLINVVRAYGATNDQKIHMKARVSGSNSSSNFRMQIMYHTYNGSTSTNPASAPNNDKLYQNAGTIRNTNPEYFVGQFYLYGIGESTRMSMTGQATYKNNSGYLHNEAFSSGSDANETTSGIEFTMASGNIYGTFSLYGLVT